MRQAILAQCERVKAALSRAYRRLHEEGHITADELEVALDVVESLESLTMDEIKARLEAIGKR